MFGELVVGRLSVYQTQDLHLVLCFLTLQHIVMHYHHLVEIHMNNHTC